MRKLFATLALTLCLAGPALADDPKKPDDEGFVPVASDMMQQGETIPGNRLVGAAYGTIFAVVVVWVATVAARTRRVEEETEALRRKLESKGQ